MHERSVATHAHGNRFAALGIGAEHACGNGLVARDRLFLVLNQLNERIPEAVQQRHPVGFAARDGVEIVFELGGEVVIDVALKVLGQKFVNDAAHIGGDKTTLVHLHVFTILQRLNDAGVCRRAADAEFFQRLDQRGFRVARRWLGEVLLGTNGHKIHFLAFFERRQNAVLVVLFLAAAAFLIHGHETRLDQDRAVGAEAVAFVTVGSGQKIDGHGIEYGGHHLAGDGAFPDQLVEFELIGCQGLFDIAIGYAQRRGRANGLVGLLCVFGFGFVGDRFVGHVFLAVAIGDHGTNLVDRLLCQRDRVGTHVGDQTNFALANVDTFVQFLRGAHGALSAKAQLARGFLLQRGGRERCRRAATTLFLVDLGYQQLAVGGIGQRLFNLARGVFRFDGELLDLAALILDEAADEAAGFLFELLGNVGLNGPVLARVERFDLRFALANHAQGRALHPTGGQTAANLLPQQWREIEANQIVQCASRLLRIDQVVGQRRRLIDGFANRLFGDLVEHHAMHVFVFENAALAQQFDQMPGDGFAFAIRVSGKIQSAGFFQRLDDGVNVAFIFLNDRVFHGKRVIRIDGAFLGDQVANVSVRGQNLEVLAQIFLDRLRLRR